MIKSQQKIILLVLGAVVFLCMGASNVGEDWTSSSENFSTSGTMASGTHTITGNLVHTGTVFYDHGTGNSIATTMETKFGENVSDADFDSFENAVSDIGVTVTTIKICSDIVLAEGTAATTPSTLTLDFTCGGTIHGTAGGVAETLAINGPYILDSGRAVFDANVTVTYTNIVADPCGGLPTGAVFYNSTSNYPCFCNGAGADIKMNDNATACF